LAATEFIVLMIVGDAAWPQGPDRIRVAHADALTLDELGGALAAA
jgi:hypothetical protein